MSTFKHPVGPQPSKVYWRRRLLVGLGILAVIVVIVLIALGAVLFLFQLANWLVNVRGRTTAVA